MRRITLPSWTTHPGFAVVVLFVVAVLLIVHGEPQPSSRPSGKSVVVSGSATAPTSTPATLMVIDGILEWRNGRTVRRIDLPAAAKPRTLVTNRGLSVVLAVLDGRQRAYAIPATLKPADLGLADGAAPAADGTSSVIVESAVTDPGRIRIPAPTPTDTGSISASSSDSVTSSTTTDPRQQPALQDYLIRRYDSSGQAVGPAQFLPSGMRVGTDTAVGLVVWQPVNRIFDNGQASESVSARAVLIRPDRTERVIGALNPLAATKDDLLVWNVATRQFGLLPLRYATATSTVTASPSGSSPSESRSADVSASPTASPTTVAGARFFNPTKGIVVTGPATFAPDASAFAVYAQVGARRRLVVGEISNQLADQIEVLALAQPDPRPGSTTGSVTGTTSPSGSPSSTSPTPSAEPVFYPDGFPIPAPLEPAWWSGLVVAVGPDSTVVGYRPGSGQASQLDLGAPGLSSLALAP